MEKKTEKRQRGIFIALEGIDGCGKTTVAKLLSVWLKKRGFETLNTKEPTISSPAGEKIYAVLNHRVPAPSPLDFQKLYVADRTHHVARIITPALKRGMTVISQRYMLSTFAYGTAAGISYMKLMKLHRDMMGKNFRVSDVTCILDLPPRLAMQRIARRGAAPEYFEREKKLSKVRKQYLWLTTKKDLGLLYVVDARPAPVVIFKKIQGFLRSKVTNE